MNYDLQPGLYLVPTPIGNLDDITVRAKNTLAAADIIACEDTRHSGILLKSLGIDHKRLISYHEHNEAEKSSYIVSEIEKGLSVALISDAGSPGISDPGYRVVRASIEAGLYITALPGPSAIIPAITASGLAVNSFIFAGFPPQKKGRKTFLEKYSNIEHTVVMYESPHRINKLVEELKLHCGPDRQLVIAREITKKFEEFVRGTIEEVSIRIAGGLVLKGEIVVVLDGITTKKAKYDNSSKINEDEDDD